MIYVHYDVTALYDVCETANGPRLLFFTSTLRSGDVNEGRWVVVDSEYHHQHALLDTLNDIGCKMLESTKHKLFGSVLFNTETLLFLTQPLTISYPLKDSNSLFFRKHFSYAVI